MALKNSRPLSVFKEKALKIDSTLKRQKDARRKIP
jgi:hypothetical protein